MTALATTRLLSPQPPMPNDVRYLDREDNLVFVVVEPADPDAEAYRIRCGMLGAGETWDFVPAEFMSTYMRWIYEAEDEIEEMREAQRQGDFDRAFANWDYESGRGL